MYFVKVIHISSSKSMTCQFQFGELADIGYWLDSLGYIDSKYKIEITITD